MTLDGLCKLLHLWNPTAACPAVPLVEQYLSLLTTLSRLEDLPQGLLQLPRLSGLEAHPTQGVHLIDLVLCPVGGILKVTPAATNQVGLSLNLLSAYLVHHLIDHLYDMELIKADLSPGKSVGSPCLKASGHVHTDIRNVFTAAVVLLQIIHKPLKYPGFSPLCGKQYSVLIKIMKERDVVVSSSCSSLIDTKVFDAGKVLLISCLGDVVVKNSPDPIVAPNVEQILYTGNRHRLTG